MNLSLKLKAFSAAMRAQFDACESRGGWRGRGVEEQFIELNANISFLRDEIEGGSDPSETLQESRARILALAADVANAALIIADNAGAIVERMEG